MSSIVNHFQLFISQPYVYNGDMCVYASEGRLAISFIFSNLKSGSIQKELSSGCKKHWRLCGTNRLRLENRREQNKKSVLDEGRDMPRFERRRMCAIEIVHKRAMYRERGTRESLTVGHAWETGTVSSPGGRLDFSPREKSTDFSFDRERF